MKIVRYYWTQGGRLYPIELDSELVQHVKWNRAETLKVEIWPFDLKIGPFTQIPYGKTGKNQKYICIVVVILELYFLKI